MGIRIDDIPAALAALPDHTFAVMVDGQTFSLTLAQITTLIITLIVDGSSEALDTLNELAEALGNDPDFSATVTTALGNRLRVDAAQGLNSTQRTQGRANLDVSAKVAASVDNTVPRFDGLVGEIQSSSLVVSDAGSVGVNIAPTGLMDNGKGLAIGEAQSGWRQNGAGVLELIIGNLPVQQASSTGLNLVIGGSADPNVDIAVGEAVALQFDFVAKGKGAIAFCTFHVEQTGGTGLDYFVYMKLIRLSTSTATIGRSAVRRSNGNVLTGGTCGLSVANMTPGETYRLQVLHFKNTPTGPLLLKTVYASLASL